MFMTLGALVVIAILTFMWSTRGFLSALIHMFCVILAGAVAFAMWEPIAYFILERAPTGRSFFAFVEGQAWAIGLLAPFVVFLGVVRPILDQLIPANAQPATGVEYAGAGICGLVSGVITAGILVLAVGTMRMSTSFMGYEPIKYSGQSVKREGGMFIPFDDIVGKFYGYTSETVFSTPEPLAKWYPDPAHQAGTLRMSEGDGKAKNVARPGGFQVAGSYVIGADGSLNSSQLLSDPLDPSPHNAADLDGNPYTGPNRLLGVWIRPGDSMKEKNGQVVFGEGQIWVLAENGEGDRVIRHPVAVLSPVTGASEQYARFRFNGPKTFLATPGAAIREIAFEFVVPQGYQPLAVYFKGVREPITGSPKDVSLQVRNTALARPKFDGGPLGLGAGSGSGKSLERGPGTIRIDTARGQPSSVLLEAGISISNALPLRILIQKGTHGGLVLDEDNNIIGGKNIFAINQLQTRGMDKNLRVNKFGSPNAIVQVNVSPSQQASLLSQIVATSDRNEPPVLVDSNGRQYPAVGYVYRDRDGCTLRYTPNDPIGGLAYLQDSEGITLSISKPDAELVLVFEFSEGASLTGYGIGGKQVIEFTEPIEVRAGRR